MITKKSSAQRKAEFLRYLINGLLATVVHFGVLSALLELGALDSAGFANLIASVFGISFSFLGNRFYVFPKSDGQALDHALKFVGLYASIATLNGVVLFIWTDLVHRDYRVGFLLATGIQLGLSYFGNKYFVFRGMQTMGLKVTRSLAATALFIGLLLSLHLLHNRYFAVNVVFYAAMGDALLAAVLTVFVLLILPFFRVFGGFERLQLVMIWVLGGYAFAISVPTVIDRSLSFYILEKLQQRGGGILKARMRDVFIEEYLPEHRLVDVRLTEQLQSGTIQVVNDCVRLTAKGSQLAQLSRYYRQNFLPKHRLLMGEYTDDLTDPFRHSRDDLNYQCR